MNHYQYLTGLKGTKLTDYDNLSAYVVDVTPALAEELLALNFEHNRGQRAGWVKRWRNALETGEFFEGSVIRLNYLAGSYILTDGQHRLAAIVESGITATMTVVICEQASAGDVRTDYALLDSFGQKRSQADVITALDSAGEIKTGSLLTSYAAAARVIKANFTNTSKVEFSRLEIYPLLRDYASEIELTREWIKPGGDSASRGFVRAGVLAVALITARHADADKARSFWSEAVQDDGLRKHDPRKKLNEYLRVPAPSGGSQQMTTAAVAAKCWNAHIAGEEIIQLKIPASVPPIALTPYPLKSGNGSGDGNGSAHPEKLI